MNQKNFINQFATIALNKPWLKPYESIHKALALSIDCTDYHKDTLLFEWLNDYFLDQKISLTHQHNHRLKFTHQNDLQHGIGYENYIHTHGLIPIRDNLHDWFGACVWSVFSQSKSLLNTKHIQYTNDNQHANRRNKVRDTITLFDENGAILVVCDDDIGHRIANGLYNFDWQTCLVDTRSYWVNPNCNISHVNQKAQVFLFGHALLEQLINPYKSLCSHTLIIQVPDCFFEQSLEKKLSQLDDYLYRYLSDFLNESVTPKQLSPLPILGVPYFWDNTNPIFYQDAFVFRSGRKHQKSTHS